jgi:biotin-dependent carboxylase-like uncharacterized protein
MIEIVATGARTTVQDLGRVGSAGWGIPPGGAADRGSLRLANRLVGNPEGAAAFEVLLGGSAFRFGVAALVAVTGANAPVLVEGVVGRGHGPQWVPAGSVLQLLAPPGGLRSYVAVRGGLATAPILGSRSVDESSGIGRALRAGDVVPIGAEAAGPPTVDIAPQPMWPSGPVTLHAVTGPRDDWFTEASVRRFVSEKYTVEPASDRVGLRLSGTPLQRRIDAELLSEPTLRGAIEVPANGLPIVFGADHPTTCGYPVVAVLDAASADLAAQCRPGQVVTFALHRPQIRLFTSRPEHAR